MRILIGSLFQITWWQGRIHGPRACGAALHLSVMSRCAPLCFFFFLILYLHLTCFSRCEASDWWGSCSACFASLKRFPSSGKTEIWLDTVEVAGIVFLRGLETQYTRLGFGGYWGSKGCVSIRFSGQTEFCAAQTKMLSGSRSREFHSAS